ncbi:uncharacterized protein ACR2FA_009518 [Aphomia sociella]
MSGGQLVVLDRLGRDVKRYPLPEGLATLGSDPACDIRVMLPSVSAHHATVVVHANQTVVRNVSSRETLVNGRGVSVAALRHGDVIALGGRQLRWEYDDPAGPRRPDAGRGGRPVERAGERGGERGGGRRGSGPPPPPPRSPGLQLALEMRHRASMPANAGGKQVAIVQPQRRDTSDLNDQHQGSPRSNTQTNKRSRSSNNELDTSVGSENEKSKRKSNTRPNAKSPVASLQSQGTTKATLWIESRKTSPRKSGKVQSPAAGPAARRRASHGKCTPLRLAVLRKAQSAQKVNITKIEAPLKIDHTKQAAIMLMTGHTPKKVPSPKNVKKTPKTPTYLVKKPSPIRKTPHSGRKRGSKESAVTPKSVVLANDATPKTDIIVSSRNSRRTRNSEFNQSVPTIKPLRGSRSQRSPLLPTPKKSALKDPSAKKSSRKTESIKFDLSNLENHNEESQDVFMVSDSTQSRYDVSSSYGEEDLTLRYSDTSNIQSPSPRKSIHSRSSKILERSLGTPMTETKSSVSLQRSTLTPESPRARKSSRGSVILQKALRPSENTESNSRYSQRTTKSLSDESYNTTVASAFKTRTLSPRSPSRNNLESYSIVDLVSVDSSGSIGNRSSSVYNSVRSKSSNNSSAFGTPQSNGRKTRSTIEPILMSSSTPYVAKVTRASNSRSQSSPNIGSNKSSKDDSQLSTRSTRRSKSLTTPENTQKYISVNSTRISRASRSRSRINDSDLLLISSQDTTEMDDVSPKSSKRLSRANKSKLFSPANKSGKRKSTINPSPNKTPNNTEGASTPENRNSPEEVGTPVLSIQSLLDSSQSSLASQRSQKSQNRGRSSVVARRKTIGVIHPGPRRGRMAAKSKSLNFGSRKSQIRLSKDSLTASDKTDEGAPAPDNEDIVTPKSAVKLVQEAVKNKHSTAKKPQSKRSIIDDLNESDIVKQLFNSPVKRKLSQSMSEFSRKQLFDDDDIIISKRPTRNTIAVAGRTPDNTLLEQTESYSPEVFVSPLGTPSNSPNLTGIKRLFAKRTPDNDLRNVRGVKKLLRTPRTRKSVRNDLTQVSGVKKVFARSPKNRLSDVRVKEIFAALPKNDLTRVSGVKSLFQTKRKNKSPKNDLSDVRGVKNLFIGQQSPTNDLRNVSGVKKALQRNSPRNDLTDVRGVRGIFRQRRQHRDDLNDVSGVEELFNLSNNSQRDTDNIFDQLVGKPTIKAVYSKTFVKNDPKQKSRKSKAKTLHASIDTITNNVEEWLEQELQKRLQKEKTVVASNTNASKANLTRELQKLATNTVEGSTPFRQSRIRNSMIVSTTVVSERKKSASELYSAHTLPLKKRSLVEVSLDKINNESRSNILPIKKRLVVHSTPVKGRSNLTMNASELGRVSPIAAVEKTRQGDVELNTSIQEPPTVEIQLPKGRRATRTKVIESKGKSNAEVKVSPAKTRVSKSKVESSAVRATRARRSNKTENSQQLANTKKRRVSLVIIKKAPVLSPKPATRKGKVERKEATQELPKEVPTKRSTRRQKEEIEVNTTKTPKKTRAKVQKASVVISKPSPVLKPRAARGKQKEVVPEPVQLGTSASKGRARKTVVPSETTKDNVKKGKQNKVKSPKQTTKTRESRATRGRQSKLNNSEPQPKRGKNAQNKSDSQKAEPKSKTENANTKARGKKTVVKTEVQETKTRGRGKVAKVEEIVPEKAKTRGKNESIEKGKTRGKKTQPEPVAVPTPPKRRAANKVPGNNTVSEDVRGRKRKIAAEQEQPNKLRKTRSEDIAATKAKDKKTVEKETRGGRQKKSAATESNVSKGAAEVPENKSRSARSRKTEQVAPVSQKEEAKPVRGRKTVAVVDNATQRGGRKRKTIAETPDKTVKESNKKQPPAKRTRKTAEVPAASARPRLTRAAEVTKRTGRGGKR